MDEGFCVSPQTIALMVEETKHVPYQVAYYPAMNTFEKEKNELAEKSNMIVVGTVPVKTKSWYDAVVGLDDAESIKDYTKFDEDFNVNHYTTLTLKDADVVFNHFDELRYFLIKILQQEKKR